MNLHPAAGATPTQPALDPGLFPAAPNLDPGIDTSRVPAGLHHGGAKPRTCPKCSTWLLTAIVPMHIDIDPHHIATPQLEYAAMILGRWTYTLHGRPGRHELTIRTYPDHPQPMIAPASDRIVVVADHHCGRPPLTHRPIPLFPAPAHPNDGPPPF